MIAFLEGSLKSKTPSSALINVSGVGFELGMSTSSLAALPDLGQDVFVHTYLQVREDGMLLYGFVSLEEKALFEKLITVSGVGPKVALAALSSYPAAQLTELITNEDVSAIQRVPGVGKKMASRIILELKGTLAESMDISSAEQNPAFSRAMSDARAALLSMGFTKPEIDLALKGAPADGTDSALLQYALKKLG